MAQQPVKACVYAAGLLRSAGRDATAEAIVAVAAAAGHAGVTLELAQIVIATLAAQVRKFSRAR
jgi:hypothetical protein